MLETTYVEIKTKSNKGIIVGYLYKPPNMNETAIIQHIKGAVSKMSGNWEEGDNHGHGP